MTYNQNIFLESSKLLTVPTLAQETVNYTFTDLDDCEHTIYSVKTNLSESILNLTRPNNNYVDTYGKKATFINTGTNLIKLEVQGLTFNYSGSSSTIDLQANQCVTLLFTDSGYSIVEKYTISTT